ncbi:radical SAM protein [bacterium]|nr:radical SAM protein [candidate division CSSED10-310 bacterium]
MTDYMKQIIALNHREYGERYDDLRWITEEEAEAAALMRQRLLDDLLCRINTANKGTKLFSKTLSLGCQTCQQGTWSCLFINGRCNCRCFYCPSRQDYTDVPTTNSVPFRKVTDYVDYVRLFQFSGVSISGGEPLLTPDLTLKFLTKVRETLGDDIYLWLYTNGTYINKEILLRLRDAGLDELRFDIGATKYSLKKARLAVGIVNHVTVEIPAVPEDEGVLEQKIHEMADAGISYLNLHQLRVTPHNLNHIIDRNYRVLHGEKVTVLDSELTALRLMNTAEDKKIKLPINYCSFGYKNRYQRKAARLRNARWIIKPYESLTDNGYIRQIVLRSDPESVTSLIDTFKHHGFSDESWMVNSGKDCLMIDLPLIECVDTDRVKISVCYYEATFQPVVSYRHPFVSVPINAQKSIIVEKRLVSEVIDLNINDIDNFVKLALGAKCTFSTDRCWDDIERYERIPQGLQMYF